MSISPGAVALRFPARAYFYLIASSFAFTWLMYCVWRWLPTTHEGRFLPEELYQGRVLGPAVVFSLVSCLLLWARQPRGATITWDEYGLTEWDGEGVRCAIAWTDAKRFRREIRIVKRGERGGGEAGGHIDQYSDSAGRRITVAMTPSPGPAFLLRRRSTATWAELPNVTEPGEDIVPHGATRRPSWKVWPLRAGYLLAAMGAWGLYEQKDPQASMAFFAVAALALVVRALRPVWELVGTLRVDRSFDGAEPVELIGNEGTLLHVRDRNGQQATLDTRSFAHADALLAIRRGPAFLRFRAGEAAGYRGRAMLDVEAIEIKGTRTARRDLQRALLGEIAVRLAVAGMMAAAAATFF